jgi:hypothetical protein
MAASAIAYLLCAVFGVIGLLGMGITASYGINRQEKFAASFFTAALFLGLAWLFAFLGGI